MKLKNLFENIEYKSGNLYMINSDLTKDNALPEYLKGLKVTGNFNCVQATLLKSIKNAPSEVYGDVNLTRTEITSLEGIGKNYLTYIEKNLLLPKTLTSNILGILKIENLARILVDSPTPNDLLKAFRIVHNHLISGRNLRKCKLELFEAGLSEYAKL